MLGGPAGFFKPSTIRAFWSSGILASFCTRLIFWSVCSRTAAVGGAGGLWLQPQTVMMSQQANALQTSRHTRLDFIFTLTINRNS